MSHFLQIGALDPSLVGWVQRHLLEDLCHAFLFQDKIIQQLRIRVTRAFRMSRLFRSVPELMILVHGMFQVSRDRAGANCVCVLFLQSILEKSETHGRFHDVSCLVMVEFIHFIILLSICCQHKWCFSLFSSPFRSRNKMQHPFSPIDIEKGKAIFYRSGTAPIFTILKPLKV